MQTIADFIQHLVSSPSFDVICNGVASLPKDWGGKREFHRRGLANHLLWYVADGNIQVMSKSGVREISSGSVMWVHGGDNSKFLIKGKCNYVQVHYLRFRLHSDWRRAIGKTLLIAKGVPALDQRFRSFRNFQRSLVDDRAPLLQLRLRLADLLMDILKYEESAISRERENGCGLGKKRQELCLAYIDKNLNRFFSLHDLASHCRLNPVYFSKLFKVSFGMSFQEYIKTVRIGRAQSLLIETNLNIGEISDQLGYQDINYFSRQFKQEAGLSPANWRKQVDQ